MKSKLLLIAFLSVGLWAEPSVYGGGSSSSSKYVKRNKNSIYKLKQETADLREDIQGLRSIIEGMNRTISRLKQQRNSGGSSASLDSIRSLLNKIDRNYVTKDELRRALKGQKISKIKKQVKKANQPKISKSNNLEKASSSALYSKGVRLVNKKRYSDAKKRFSILSSRGYKKASTHFYLGEIAYRTSKYSKAVEEYKHSAELDETAGYMDKLLLHTGISLEKSGDTAQAKRFFQAIVDGYPDTSSAKVAKKHL